MSGVDFLGYSQYHTPLPSCLLLVLALCGISDLRWNHFALPMLRVYSPTVRHLLWKSAPGAFCHFQSWCLGQQSNLISQ